MTVLSPIEMGRRGFASLPIVGTVFAGTTGFQSPADDYIDERIDLAKELITTHPNTFCWRVCGDSFREVGVLDGSVAVIDYSKTPKSGDIVMVKLGDVVTLKIIKLVNGSRYLASATRGYPIIPIDAEEGVHVYGVLKHCLISY